VRDAVACAISDTVSSPCGHGTVVAALAYLGPARGLPIGDVGSKPAGVSVTALFRAHGQFVFRVLGRLGVPDDARDDAVQDVFLVALRRAEDLRADVPARSWLFGIARRVAARYHRSHRRADNRRPAAEPPGPADPEAVAAGREELERVRVFLEALPERLRLVFVLCEVEGMTAPEAAEALDTNVNTVNSRLRKARAAFQRAAARWTRQEATS
jgi:RNA polymerase sigma-70 factor, ECF subfamily